MVKFIQQIVLRFITWTNKFNKNYTDKVFYQNIKSKFSQNNKTFLERQAIQTAMTEKLAARKIVLLRYRPQPNQYLIRFGTPSTVIESALYNRLHKFTEKDIVPGENINGTIYQVDKSTLDLLTSKYWKWHWIKQNVSKFLQAA